jgi:hypothetical protein
MYADAKKSFAFLVLAFNHQEYILEHLESIKYLVQNHGAAWDIDLIVNDDASRDQTRNLVDRWLTVNAKIFRQVKTLYNSKNLGTCASVNNMLSHMVAERCKLTAGDDVYSFENIFELTAYSPDTAMVSGRALFLLGDELCMDLMANTLTTATQVIYQRDSLLHRFKHLSYNNAPNLLYATKCLLNPKVREFLQRFDVVEDWPLQVAIAREYPEYRLELIDKVLVYYRRTPGSTYIVANQRFIKDKLQIYTDLIQNENNSWEQFRLKTRRYCFKTQNQWLNKLLNIDWYIYLILFVMNFYKIYRNEKLLNLSVIKHKKHYNYINEKAVAFIKNEKM